MTFGLYAGMLQSANVHKNARMTGQNARGRSVEGRVFQAPIACCRPSDSITQGSREYLGKTLGGTSWYKR